MASTENTQSPARPRSRGRLRVVRGVQVGLPGPREGAGEADAELPGDRHDLVRRLAAQQVEEPRRTRHAVLLKTRTATGARFQRISDFTKPTHFQVDFTKNYTCAKNRNLKSGSKTVQGFAEVKQSRGSRK